MSTPTILLALPSRLLRESLSKALQHHLSAKVTEAGSGAEVFAAIDQTHPSVLLIDSNLPGINTIEIIRHIAVYCSTVRTIAISTAENAHVAAVLRNAGAHGCVSYSVTQGLLFKVVSEVSSGGEYFPESVLHSQDYGEHMESAKDAGPMVALTRKELEVASLVKTGFTTRGIAHQMGLSVSTVELHRYHILKKLRMKRSTSLINYLSTFQTEQTNVGAKSQSGLKN